MMWKKTLWKNEEYGIDPISFKNTYLGVEQIGRYESNKMERMLGFLYIPFDFLVLTIRFYSFRSISNVMKRGFDLKYGTDNVILLRMLHAYKDAYIHAHRSACSAWDGFSWVKRISAITCYNAFICLHY